MLLELFFVSLGKVGSYAKAAIKAMARLDRPIRERIRKWIEEELPCK